MGNRSDWHSWEGVVIRAHFHVKPVDGAYVEFILHLEPGTDEEAEMAAAFAAASQCAVTPLAALKEGSYGLSAYVPFPKKIR